MNFCSAGNASRVTRLAVSLALAFSTLAVTAGASKVISVAKCDYTKVSSWEWPPSGESGSDTFRLRRYAWITEGYGVKHGEERGSSDTTLGFVVTEKRPRSFTDPIQWIPCVGCTFRYAATGPLEFSYNERYDNFDGDPKQGSGDEIRGTTSGRTSVKVDIHLGKRVIHLGIRSPHWTPFKYYSPTRKKWGKGVNVAELNEYGDRQPTYWYLQMPFGKHAKAIKKFQKKRRVRVSFSYRYPASFWATDYYETDIYGGNASLEIATTETTSAIRCGTRGLATKLSWGSYQP